MLTIDGKPSSLRAWARRHGIATETLRERVAKWPASEWTRKPMTPREAALCNPDPFGHRARSERKRA